MMNITHNLLFKLFIIWLVTVLISCSVSQEEESNIPIEIRNLENLTVYPRTKNPDTLILHREQTFGNTDSILVGRIIDIAVDRSGRVFIGDIQKQVIHVFNPNGRFLRQLGREGKGPSEFGSIKGLQIRKDRLYAFDPHQFKVSVFTLDTLAGHKTIFLARNRGDYQPLQRAYPYIEELHVKNNNTYIAEFISDSSRKKIKWQNFETKGLLYLLDNTGKIVSEKLVSFKKATRTQFAWHNSKTLLGLHLKPFFGNALAVLSSDNSIYWAGPDHFLIKEYSPEGVYRHAFYYPHKNIALTRESAIEAGAPDLYIRNLKSMDLPESWPVLTDIKIDDQERLWVATTVNDMKVYQWWIFKPDGQLIARFNWPKTKPIQVVKNGHLYTRETEEETGLQQIVRYHIEMEPSKK